MRILLVNHEFTITGASTLLLRLAEHLRARGHAITIFASVVHHGPIKESYLAAGFAVRDTVDYRDYELVLCNTIFTAERVVQAAPFAKTIWWLHEAESGLAYLLENLALRRAFGDATAVVFQTAFQRDTVYRSFTYMLEAQKLVVIPNGPEADLSALPHDRVPPKRRPIRVLTVGMVDPRKRQEDLIRAVHWLASPDIECVICGKFFELAEDALAIMAEAPERFTLLPELPRQECLAWIAACDIFCLPSSSESQSLTAIEAGLLGKPLLLSDLRTYRGIFAHGRNCLLFPMGDPVMLGHSLAMLARNANLRQRLGKAALETARWFAPDAFYAGFDVLLSRVCR